MLFGLGCTGLRAQNIRKNVLVDDTLFSRKGAGEALYANFSVPINDQSIVGYAALTGESVVIDEAIENNIGYLRFVVARVDCCKDTDYRNCLRRVNIA